MTQPADPRAGRQRRLVGFLRLATITVSAAAVVGVAVPGRIGEVAAAVMVGILLATPLTRAGWLGIRWLHKGDRRFAAVAVSLILLAGLGALIGSH